MPHQIIEYSDNLGPTIHIDSLVALLHATAAGIDAFPVAGLRTRAVSRDHYQIADTHPDNAFVHVVLRIAHGRSLEVKQAAGERIFAVLCDYLEPICNDSPIAISFEMQEINPDLRWKKNNLRNYMAKRSGEG